MMAKQTELTVGLLLGLSLLRIGAADPMPDLQADGRLEGVVRDSEGNFLANATLVLEHPERGTRIEFSTDENGSFFRRAIRPGEYVLRVELEGFRAVEQAVQIGFETTEVEITLQSEELIEAEARRDAATDAYAEGYEAFQEGRFGDAIAAMDVVLDNIDDSDDSHEVLVSALTILARSYLERRQHAQAITSYERLLELNPEDAGAHIDVGQAYAEQLDMEAARKHFDAALALTPDDPNANYNVGVILLQAGEVEESIAALERCLELQPQYPLAHKSLGYGYARMGDNAKAVEHFEAYLQQLPEAPDKAEIEQFIAALKGQVD